MSCSGFSGPVETAIGVASGLKLYSILFQLGFTKRTTINCVDSSRTTLRFKEWLLANWDGRDYAQAVFEWLARQESGTRLQHDFSKSRVIEGAERFYASFGGEDTFVKYWKEFRELPHTFCYVDLFTMDYRTVLEMIPAESNHVVVWFSNVFHSSYTHSIIGHDEGEKLYRGWVSMLKERNRRVLLICKDHFGASVNARVSDVVSETSVPIFKNKYFPKQIINWFNTELHQLRSAANWDEQQGDA